MIFTDHLSRRPKGAVGVPPDPNLPPNGKHLQEPMGRQQAFLCGTGTMRKWWSSRKTATTPSSSAPPAPNTSATRSACSSTTNASGRNPGGRCGRKPSEVLYAYSTRVIPLKAGRHTVRFEGADASPEAAVFIDGVQVSSIDEFMRMIPSKGQETSGKASDRWAETCRKMCAFARLWGLVPCTYEGGWSLGGDWDSGGMNHWLYAKYESPRAVDAGFRSVSLYSKAGGWMFAYGTYSQFPRSKWTAPRTIRSGRRCAAERVVGVQPRTASPLPATLTPEQDHYWNTPGQLASITGPPCYGYDKAKRDSRLTATGWKSWFVIAPKTATYAVTATTGAGGEARAQRRRRTDGRRGASGVPLTGKVLLTAGQHAIKIKCLTSECEVHSISIREGNKAMKLNLTLLAALLPAPLATLQAAAIKLVAPLDYQVIQRTSPTAGTIRFREVVRGFGHKPGEMGGTHRRQWQTRPVAAPSRRHSRRIYLKARWRFRPVAGIGWKCSVSGDAVAAETAVEHVGVGEVFVVAGQSNSANHGEEKQRTKTGKVADLRRQTRQ